MSTVLPPIGAGTISRTERDSPLFRLNRERHDIIDEVVERVTRGAIERAWQSPEHGLEYLLNEAAFLEMSRLEEADGAKAGQRYAFWRDIAHSVGRASEEENAELLHTIVTRYARDIAGHFRPGVFRFATQMLPPSISLLFARSGGRGLKALQPNTEALREHVRIEGELGKLRRLAEVGTLLVVPTHSSHMDSLLIGWALHECGLPPVCYGAGKNLFSNPMTSFFMANLGAYKVDRRLRHTIYKNVLKAYSQILLERGYHSLFFPGGTRSRSNGLEQHLKLGLLGTALDAYTRNVVHGHRQQQIYVVPVTINYNLVLEAETLIEEHLKQGGQGRYIIEDDEFSDIRRVAQFVRSALEMETSVTMRFCTPMDVFGNEVDLDGESIDGQGRRVDPERYLWVQGRPAVDRERDMQYTRQLGEKVARSYADNNVISPLHLVSFAVFEHLRRQHPTWDLYRCLRFSRGEVISRAVVEGETERLVRLARREASDGRFLLARQGLRMSASAMVDEALRYWNTYHTSPVALAEHQNLRLLNPKLMYYYGNRLRGYDLERRLRIPGGY